MPGTVVITIARQLGSGGSYIGWQVAKRLGYAYIDRLIMQQAAKELGSRKRRSKAAKGVYRAFGRS